MSKLAVIIGYSGHSYVLLDALETRGYELRGYIDREKKEKNPYNLQYLGSESDNQFSEMLKDSDIFIAIGDNEVRRKIFNNITRHGASTPNLIHGKALVSPYAVVNPAAVVMAGAVINSLALIGKGVICNTSSIVEHECRLGDFVHLAPGAVLAGNVHVGENTFIGANSVVKQGVSIGSNVTVGAGSVILRDIPDDAKVYGNPGKLR